MRPATIGEANAVSVAWCQPRSRMPGERRLAQPLLELVAEDDADDQLAAVAPPARSPQASAAGMMSDGCDGSCFQ